MNKKDYKQKCEVLERNNTYMKELMQQMICSGQERSRPEADAESDREETGWDFIGKNACEGSTLEIVKAFAAGEEAEDRQQIRKILSELKDLERSVKELQKNQKKYDRFMYKLEGKVYEQTINLKEAKKDMKKLREENKEMKSDFKGVVKKLRKKSRKMRSDIKWMKEIFFNIARQHGLTSSDFKKWSKYMLKNAKQNKKDPFICVEND